MSSTASQAGETDQTTRIDSAEHPESCQIASPTRNLRRRKSPSVPNVETAYELAPSKASQKTNQHRTISRCNSDLSDQRTQCNDQPQQTCNLLLQIHRDREKVNCPLRFRHSSIQVHTYFVQEHTKYIQVHTHFISVHTWDNHAYTHVQHSNSN